MSQLRDIDRWFIDEVLPHESRFLALAGRLSASPEEASDIVQDVYARLFASDAWQVIDNPPAYVMRMVRNQAIGKLRRARIVSFQSVADPERFGQADDAPDAFDQTASRQSLRRLLAAISELPPRCREVVVMRRLDGLPPREIAQRLGLSLSTLEKRLARGLFLLARSLDGEYGKPAARPDREQAARRRNR